MNKNIIGFAAIILIQSATLPAVLKAIDDADSIPIMMPCLLSAGMLLLLIRALQDKDSVYIVSNGLGLSLNILLLLVILTS